MLLWSTTAPSRPPRGSPRSAAANRTQGLDVVAAWAPPRLGGRTTFGFLFNHTRTDVTHHHPAVLDALRIRELEEAIPGTRWNATVRQALGRWSLLGRLSWYDEWFDSRDSHVYRGDAVLDLEAAYPLGASTTLALGGQNVLGNDPEENPHAAARGNRFSSFTPFGVNGVHVKILKPMKGRAYTPSVQRALRALGCGIGIARRKRRMPVADFAARMGVSPGTLVRLEKGEAGVSIGSLAMAFLALGELHRLEDLLDVSRDETGLLLDLDNLPRRIRRRKPRPG